jgi:hypothetical protein
MIRHLGQGWWTIASWPNPGKAVFCTAWELSLSLSPLPSLPSFKGYLKKKEERKKKNKEYYVTETVTSKMYSLSDPLKKKELSPPLGCKLCMKWTQNFTGKTQADVIL